MEKVFQEHLTQVRAEGRTVLLSATSSSEVETAADRVSIVRAGRIVDSGPSPAPAATLDVIRDEGLVDNARVVGATLAPGLDKVAAGNTADRRRSWSWSHARHRVRHPDGQPDSSAAVRAQQQSGRASACCS